MRGRKIENLTLKKEKMITEKRKMNSLLFSVNYDFLHCLLQNLF